MHWAHAECLMLICDHLVLHSNRVHYLEQKKNEFSSVDLLRFTNLIINFE